MLQQPDIPQMKTFMKYQKRQDNLPDEHCQIFLNKNKKNGDKNAVIAIYQPSGSRIPRMIKHWRA